MPAAPEITASDIRSLLASPAEEPVLHIELDEDNGTPGQLGVWARALVPHQTIVLTREDAEDLLGSAHHGDPDDDTIEEFLPQLQEDVARVFAELA